MFQSRKNYIYYIFVLGEYMMNIFGMNYPKEIIELIIMSVYKPIQISCGLDHTILLSDKIYVWGQNDNGQLGLGHEKNVTSPTELILPMDIKSISCGWYHNIALTYVLNKLCVWGNNTQGQLGLGHNKCQKIPIELFLCATIKSVSCGGYHTVALTVIPNKIYVWGSNESGQLGLGNVNDKNLSHELILHKPIISISCGGFHTVALTGSEYLNKIYVWGCNHIGELGLGDFNDRNIPCELNLQKNVIAISCGEDCTIALTDQNDIYMWGRHLGYKKGINLPKKLIIGDSIVSICCGNYFAIALTKSKNYYSWGCLGCPRVPKKPTYDKANFISSEPKYFIHADPIISVSCGGDHIIAVSISDKIYVWGHNGCDQLGLGDNIDQKSPKVLEFKF